MPGWNVQALPVLLALVGIALFAQGFVRLRRRAPEHAPWTRPPLYALAIGCAVLPLVSPLDGYADDYLLAAHMLEHVLIGDVAPALAIVAVRGPLVFFLVPPATLRALAGVRWLRASAAFLLRPGATFAVWLPVTAGWHVPAAYGYALDHRWAHDLEHLSFVAAGALLWAQLVDPARRRALGAGGRVLFAWAIFVAGMASTHLFLLDSTPHYRRYVEQPHRVFGWSPLTDQHWAAWTMTAEQVLAFGLLTLVLVRRIPIPDRAGPTL